MLRLACCLSILFSLVAASTSPLGFSTPQVWLLGHHRTLSSPLPTHSREKTVLLPPIKLQQRRWPHERNPLCAGQSNTGGVVSAEDASYQRNRKLISQLKKARDAERVFSLLDEILEAEEAPPSLHAYTSALSACSRYGGHANVMELLDRMDRQGVAADFVALKMVLASCCAAEEWAAALRIWERIVAGHAQQADCAAFNLALQAAAALGQVECAVGVLSVLEGSGVAPNARTPQALAPLLSPHPHHPDPDPALLLLARRLEALVAAGEAERARPPAGAESAGAWWVWRRGALLRVQARLQAAVGGEGDAGAWRNLSSSLHLAAAHGAMPSFASGGARAAYTLDKLVSRTGRTADLLELAALPWLRRAVRALLLAAPRPARVLSVGGGPGFDLLAVALLRRFHTQHAEAGRGVGCGVAGLVLDYEAGWASLLQALRRAAQPELGGEEGEGEEWELGGADIREGLGHAANAALRAAARRPSPALYFFSYVVAENAQALAASDYALLHDLFLAAHTRSLFVLTETTHRLWPAVVAALQRAAVGQSTHSFRADFTSIPGRRGFALVVEKLPHAGELGGQGDVRMSAESVALMERFELDLKLHEGKLAKLERQQQEAEEAEQLRKARYTSARNRKDAQS